MKNARCMIGSYYQSYSYVVAIDIFILDIDTINFTSKNIFVSKGLDKELFITILNAHSSQTDIQLLLVLFCS